MVLAENQILIFRRGMVAAAAALGGAYRAAASAAGRYAVDRGHPAPADRYRISVDDDDDYGGDIGLSEKTPIRGLGA